jgi:F-type H+-transporting ATPase subunit epsilon
MKNSITLQIISPGRKHRVDQVAFLSVHLIDGSIGILPGHAPLLAETTAGDLHYRQTNGEEYQQALDSPGILLVSGDGVTIFLHGMEAGTNPMPVRLLQETLAIFEMDGNYAEKEG